MSSRDQNPGTDGQRGVAMVEFAFVAPTAFLVLLGLIVVGLTVANQNLLTDAVRDTARAAAVCGGFNRDPNTKFPAPTGNATPTSCGTDAATSWANFGTYANSRLGFLAGSGGLSAPPAATSNCEQLPKGGVNVALVCLYDANNARLAINAGSNPLWDCQQGDKLEVSGQAAQPLYLPLVGNFLGNNGSTTTRTLTADAEAVCEQ